TVAGALDYETASSHSITVLATSADGSSNSQSFTIDVGNVNDNPVVGPSDSNAAANLVLENAAIGATVGLTAFASDADAGGQAITYSLSDNAG
ncbi:cadherin repeat domain-containing protein, partial [Vogesella facilis]